MSSIQLLGLEAALSRVRNVPRQVRFASHQAINDVAFMARTELHAEMGRSFDRPTRYVMDSLLVKKATPQNLVARVSFEYIGGKGVEPTDVLRAEVAGGGRKLKKSERALQRVGILPQGYFMVPTKELLASDKGDGYGNVRGSFLVQLISYFNAFGEQGYRANMTDKRRGALKRGTRKTVYGVEYFVSYGKLRSRKPNSDAVQHLPAGIWARRSTGFGGAVTPLFWFTRAPQYAKRFQAGATFQRVVQRELGPRFRERFMAAIATAR